MFNIGQFFKKIQNKHGQEIIFRDIIKNIIQKQSGVTVRLEGISYRNGTVILGGTTQTARSQIFIKKQSIIQEINTVQNTKTVVDIR